MRHFGKLGKFIAIILALVLCCSMQAYALTPVADNGTDYVPLRQICNTFNVGITWNSSDNTITIAKGGSNIVLTLVDNTKLVDKSSGLEIQAKLINDRTYIPLSVINSLFGVKVEWNAAVQSYEVTDWGSYQQTASILTIDSAKVDGDNLVVKGKTASDTTKSTYIQYYIGKNYPDTISECICCNGFNAKADGTFELSLPVSGLKGDGNYSIVLEQNPSSNTILAPNHWTAFTKDASGNVTFGDITSMEEISNLALTVGMQTASAGFTVGTTPTAADNSIKITNTEVKSDSVVITGTTSIDTSKSTYIQYYVGKSFDDTLSECILCNGFNANKDGSFSLTIPTTSLKGNGNYKIVLEQNPASDKILAPSHWVAFTKDSSGNITFGDITSMGEISNLALTVGMKIASADFTVGTAAQLDHTITITSSDFTGGSIIVKGNTSIDPETSSYIQFYVGKEYANTLSNCIICSGINADASGNFELTIPYASLKGDGTYTIVLEQNPKSNTILTPEHWKAFYKNDAGDVLFGDISSMKEISNLALTVGMKTAETTVTVTK